MELKTPQVRFEYIQCVHETLTNFSRENATGCWEGIKSCLLNDCGKTSAWTKAAHKRKETWWWGDTVDNQT